MSIKFTDLILHVPNFLTPDQCSFLIEEYEKRHVESILEHCPEANTDIDTYSTYERVVLTPGTEAFDLVHTSTEKMINRYLDYLDTFNAFHVGIRKSMMFSHMYRLLKYPTGTKIHQHVDHDAYIYGSCTFNLNNNYEGGDFVWFKGQHRIKLGLGDAVIWPADFFWVHEVEEITKGQRYSTNSFLQRLPQNLREQVQTLADTELQKYLQSPESRDPTHYNIKKIII
jgi:hypothetical protein